MGNLSLHTVEVECMIFSVVVILILYALAAQKFNKQFLDFGRPYLFIAR